LFVRRSRSQFVRIIVAFAGLAGRWLEANIGFRLHFADLGSLLQLQLPSETDHWIDLVGWEEAWHSLDGAWKHWMTWDGWGRMAGVMAGVLPVDKHRHSICISCSLPRAFLVLFWAEASTRHKDGNEISACAVASHDLGDAKDYSIKIPHLDIQIQQAFIL